jgi:hypothetical protein
MNSSEPAFSFSMKMPLFGMNSSTPGSSRRQSPSPRNASPTIASSPINVGSPQPQPALDSASRR